MSPFPWPYSEKLNRFIYDKRWILILLLVAFSASLRLYKLNSSPVFNDEPLWFSRSEKVIDRLHSDPLNATTHLPHPGIGAVIPMILGESAAEYYNTKNAYVLGDSQYLPHFDGGRIALALSSSTIGAVLFFGTLEWLYPIEAISAGLLALLEPQHLGASRIMHIDAMLSVYLWIALFAYIHAVEHGKTRWKIVAGLFWGLALSIKPNAAFIIPALLLYRLIRYFISKKKPRGEPGILSWSDLGVVALGHLVFVLLYSRLWYHHSEYVHRMGLRCQLAGQIFATGMQLRHNLLVSAILLLGLSIVAVFSYVRSKKGALYRHIFIISSILNIFLLLLLILPQVLEGVARYWGWALGLSEIENTSFGTNRKLPVEEWAYLKYILTALPD